MWEFKNKNKPQHTLFEDLVLDYLNITYPFANWKNPGYTQDNNRDSEAISIFTGEKMWAEVKYKYDDNKKLNSRRYDSTLVSSVLDTHVIKIYFISNTFFSDNLIERVSNFCCINEISNIVFVDKYTLETWITEHHNIQKKYFDDWTPSNKYEKYVSVRKLNILHKRDSFTIENIESNKYPLYLKHNYRFQIVVNICGYEHDDFSLICNNKKIFSNSRKENGIYIFDITPHIYSNKNSNKVNISILLKDKKATKKLYLETLKFEEQKQLSYSQEKELYNLEVKALKSQSINLITGNQFVGKSEVLMLLKSFCLSESKENQRIFYINFKGSPNDIIYITKLLLILVYDFYDDVDYNDFFRKCSHLISDIDGLNINILKDILNYTINNDSFHLLDTIKNLINTAITNFFEVNQIVNRECFFFIDNVDKLIPDIREIFIKILKSASPYKGITIIYVSRKNKLPFNNCYKINNISQTELLDNLNKINDLKLTDADLTKINKFVNTPLVLNELINVYKSTPTIETIYSFIANLSFDKLYPMNFNDTIVEVIYFITLFKDGVRITYLEKIYEFDMKELLETSYVFFENDYLYSKIDNYNIDIILNYISKDKIQKYIELDDKNYICYLGILSKLDYMYVNKNITKIIDSLKTLYWDSRYYDIVYYFNDIVYNLHANSTNNLIIKYYYVMACMNCGKNETVSDIFSSTDLSNFEIGKEYFLFASEKIDYKYWQWKDIQNLIPEALVYCKQMEKFYKNKIYMYDWEIKRAYLTLYNRIMVTYLLYDDIENAKKYLYMNILLSHLYTSPEHIGYCLMDYAKGIYHLDLEFSKKLLKYALNYFQTDKDLRRKLDCQCELQYIKILLKEDNVRSFKSKYDQLKKYHYWNQYYKALLKECALYILDNNLYEARKCFAYFSSSSVLEDQPRNIYITNLISKKILDNHKKINISSIPQPSTYLQIYTKLIYNQKYYDPRLW